MTSSKKRFLLWVVLIAILVFLVWFFFFRKKPKTQSVVVVENIETIAPKPIETEVIYREERIFERIAETENETKKGATGGTELTAAAPGQRT